MKAPPRNAIHKTKIERYRPACAPADSAMADLAAADFWMADLAPADSAMADLAMATALDSPQAAL